MGLSVTIVDSGGPMNHVRLIRREAGEVQIPNEGEKGRPIVKYWELLASAVSAKTAELMSRLDSTGPKEAFCIRL